MSNIDLEELERLAAQATPGPWVAWIMKQPLYHAIMPSDYPLRPSLGQTKHDADARFIVAACNAVPELIARVRELERQRELLARNLAEAPWCLACQIKICSNGGRDIDPLLVDRNECKNVLIRWVEQAAKEAGE